MVYPSNGIQFSNKTNEVLRPTAWMDLGNTILSERASHKQWHNVWNHLYEVFRISRQKGDQWMPRAEWVYAIISIIKKFII